MRQNLLTCPVLPETILTLRYFDHISSSELKHLSSLATHIKPEVQIAILKLFADTILKNIAKEDDICGFINDVVLLISRSRKDGNDNVAKAVLECLILNDISNYHQQALDIALNYTKLKSGVRKEIAQLLCKLFPELDLTRQETALNTIFELSQT
ncbi:MAG: hypothetical protein NTY22_04515, partial [Proteobacteria bacterium]|nr:hypothetical protein [Pseudomonadota bacterium]